MIYNGLISDKTNNILRINHNINLSFSLLCHIFPILKPGSGNNFNLLLFQHKVGTSESSCFNSCTQQIFHNQTNSSWGLNPQYLSFFSLWRNKSVGILTQNHSSSIEIGTYSIYRWCINCCRRPIKAKKSTASPSPTSLSLASTSSTPSIKYLLSPQFQFPSPILKLTFYENVWFVVIYVSWCRKEVLMLW